MFGEFLATCKKKETQVLRWCSCAGSRHFGTKYACSCRGNGDMMTVTFLVESCTYKGTNTPLTREVCPTFDHDLFVRCGSRPVAPSGPVCARLYHNCENLHVEAYFSHGGDHLFDSACKLSFLVQAVSVLQHDMDMTRQGQICGALSTRLCKVPCHTTLAKTVLPWHMRADVGFSRNLRRNCADYGRSQ